MSKRNEDIVVNVCWTLILLGAFLTLFIHR